MISEAFLWVHSWRQSSTFWEWRIKTWHGILRQWPCQELCVCCLCLTRALIKSRCCSFYSTELPTKMLTLQRSQTICQTEPGLLAYKRVPKSWHVCLPDTLFFLTYRAVPAWILHALVRSIPQQGSEYFSLFSNPYHSIKALLLVTTNRKPFKLYSLWGRRERNGDMS